METAMGALGPLLPKLGDLLVGEFNLEKRVRKGIESLVTELTLMHAALRKVAKVPPEQLDEGIKIWAVHVKELSYQMEDIINAFIVRVEDGGEYANPKNRVKKLLKKTMKLFKRGKDLHRISDALEDAVGQAKQLAEMRQRYEQEMSDTRVGTSIDPRVTALYTDVTELVGIEDTRDELINILIEGDDWLKHPLKVVSVVGFGGLGKTTLAKAVYDKIKVQFDCNAFVSVSQNPDMKKILKDILFELDKNKYEHIYNLAREERHLIDELIEFLNDKRYLIVIDDLWDKKVWEIMMCAFSKNNLGSRLITTTRIVSVSEACCSSSADIYRMKPLSGDVSRRLFYNRVFSREKGCPQELVQVSEDILKKCGGIPLAIITIASLLAINCQIKAKDQWYGLLNSIGHGLTENRSVEEMKKILLLSYNDLPFHLKPCLLYLSVYPEDCGILKSDLIWKWIAEGFVHSERQETSLYELGDSYLNELINRSLIQSSGFNYSERAETCQVHDMVFDLICSLSNEENFVTIFDGTKRKIPNPQSKVRRLSIQTKKVDVATISQSQLRSLTVFSDTVIDSVLLISSFPVLRVLDLDGCDISDIGYIEDLLHLRYLGLRETHVEKLPVQIGKLRFLQTLDIKNTGIKDLPPSIVRLRHLMCLYLNYDMKLPSGMDNLVSLEVLVGISVDIYNVDFVKELGYLTKLRVLHIQELLDLSRSKTLVESLRNLHRLENLEILAGEECGNLMRECWVPPPQLRMFRDWNGSLPTLPAWINSSSLPLLSHVTLWVDEVRPEDIRLLGTLPVLLFLNLGSNGANVKQEDVIESLLEMLPVLPADAFPCVTECHFLDIAVVPSMFPQGSAPRLKHLSFSFPAIWIARDDFDMGMRHLPSLNSVQVLLLSKEASAAEAEEAKAALRAATDDHPNHPTLVFRRV